MEFVVCRPPVFAVRFGAKTSESRRTVASGGLGSVRFCFYRFGSTVRVDFRRAVITPFCGSAVVSSARGDQSAALYRSRAPNAWQGCFFVIKG
ncbi:unnamed protein product, partial [Iphiclides podalirius]